jgi:metacaspase-1
MKRLMVAILVAVLVLVIITPAALAKPDMNKPLPATDVELVKKGTTHGKPSGGGGGKPVKQAATGELGEQLGTGAGKYAIIVGISDYPGTVNDLEYCDDDADDMYYALTTLYGYSPSNIRLLEDMGASFGAIHNAISDIKSQEVAGDEVVFFFSGHGTNGVADDGDRERLDEAIVSHDGSPSGSLIAIWDGQLKDWFAGFDTSRIIFIFDSCLAGGMTDLQAQGRIINMACSENGLSYEDDSWGNGQFTYYLVDQGMIGSKADTYDNIASVADVTIEEAFDYAKAGCQAQKPAISDSFNDDLLP